MSRKIDKEIHTFLRDVRLPARYTGGEWNAVLKDPKAAGVRMVLCYPDTYELGMSHLGLSLLYHLVNDLDEMACERCFAPWPDMAEEMKKRRIPLFSLETQTPLNAFDLIGFSLQHELLYSNLLYMLDLAGIPFRSRDRGSELPILVAGGSGALTPEPLAELFDLFLPGDGEVALPAFLHLFKEGKRKGKGKREILEEAAGTLPYAYVPAFYRPQYDGRTGLFKGMEKTLKQAPDRIVPARVEDLDRIPIPLKPIQPGVKLIHERIVLEIMRGCTRGCRFCQAGMTRRPMRTRSAESLFEAAKTIYGNTGYDEIALLSLSTSDYPDLSRLMQLLNSHFEAVKVGLSLPSLRVGKAMFQLPGLSSAVRKAGLTLAPEAATEMLRQRINKPTTDGDLYEGVLRAFELGWRRVKLYFMIGLPGETDRDVLAIARLARSISDLRKKTGKGPAKVNVTVSTFVPKGHTPLQWCAMARPQEILHKQRLLLNAGLPSRIRLLFHDSRMSLVEGMLARGDRRTLLAIEEAFREGAAFDAWKERFQLSKWEASFQKAGLDPESIVHQERGVEEPLPWEIIDSGPSRTFLQQEYERSVAGEITPYCAEAECNHCGIKPRLCARKGMDEVGMQD